MVRSEGRVATRPLSPARNSSAPTPITWEQARSGHPRQRLVGFVSSRPAGGIGPNWYLTRMAMSCCAADGYAIKIDVRGGRDVPKDTWLAVTGRWVKSAGKLEDPGTLAALQIESLQSVTKPAQTYE